jgi:hypothetical protein
MGVLTALGLVPLTLVLVVTVVGIPLVPILYAGVLGAGLLGVTALAHLIGQKVPFRSGPKTPGGILLWGMALFVLATRMPIFGTVVAVAGALVALGAVVLTRFGERPLSQ